MTNCSCDESSYIVELPKDHKLKFSGSLIGILGKYGSVVCNSYSYTDWNIVHFLAMVIKNNDVTLTPPSGFTIGVTGSCVGIEKVDSNKIRNNINVVCYAFLPLAWEAVEYLSLYLKDIQVKKMGLK